MLNDLLLLSGNDIPFIKAGITIHQPTIKEIAYIGEESFFTGCELLNFSKNILPEEDKNNLGEATNFDILIAILREKNAVMQKNRNCVALVLTLLFPLYEIKIKNDSIELQLKDSEEKFYINNNNFEDFKIILKGMFNFQDKQSDYNPSDEMAKRIADKLKKRHQKLAAEKPDNAKVDILSRYVSILTVGQKKDMNSLLNYTVYQLFDEIKRYELKVGYDIFVQAKMAGAQDLKEVEDWMKDIHS